MDNRKVSLCIPTYNRDNLLFESFEKVYNDERVSEIIISDDASDKEIFDSIFAKSKLLPKVKLYKNLTNQDCYFNKYTAVSLATNDFVILLDSDNCINTDYLDTIFSYDWDNDVILTPEFAMPNFDFRKYRAALICKENVAQLIELPNLETCLNAANFFVNKNSYLEVWDGTVNPVTSDSIYLCLKWLEAGKKIIITPNLQYLHRVHAGSHYQTQNHRTPNGFHQSVLNQLRSLK